MRFGEEENPTLGISEYFDANASFLTAEISLENFEENANKGIFMGNSRTSKAYRVYNKRTQSVEESINISFTEANLVSSPVYYDESDSHLQDEKKQCSGKENSEEIKVSGDENQENMESEVNPEGQANLDELPKEWEYHQYNLTENLLPEPSEKILTKRRTEMNDGECSICVNKLSQKHSLKPKMMKTR